jgi:hypothetical protein
METKQDQQGLARTHESQELGAGCWVLGAGWCRVLRHHAWLCGVWRAACGVRRLAGPLLLLLLVVLLLLLSAVADVIRDT